MNNNTFKNAFDANLGANFNIEATNNINKIIDTHYNIYGKIYPKNLDSTQNKFRKNNEKRQIILKNSSSVNVLLTFFHYNNTNNSWNNSWFYGENMFNFCYIKQGFWKIFRKIFEEIKENSETILKNNSSINVLLTFFHYNDSNNIESFGENMFSFSDIKQGFWKIFRKIFEKINLDSKTILENNSAVNVLLTFFPYNNTNNNWFYGENMFNFTDIKQGFWEIFRKIFEKINKFVNKTPDMFIRKFNYITEKFTNNNSEKILGNNFNLKINGNYNEIFSNKKNNFNNKKP